MSSSSALFCTTRAGHYTVSAEHTYSSSSSVRYGCKCIAVVDEASDAFALGGTEGGRRYNIPTTVSSIPYDDLCLQQYQTQLQANRNRLRALLLLRILPFP